MAIQTINLGMYANDGTGDDLRTAFTKVNSNFQELTTAVNIANGENIGTGVGIFAQRNLANLQFKKLSSSDNTVNITSTADTVNLSTITHVESDTSPLLGGDLGLNGNIIYGPGDVQSTIYGYDILNFVGIVELLILSNQLNIDMGTFNDPSGGGNNGINLDMNGTGNLDFVDSADNLTTLDFGTF